MHPDAARQALQRACWNCTHYAGIAPCGNSARCMHRGQLHIHSPIGGCVYFTREPGADDRLALPPGFDLGGMSPVWRDAVREVLAREPAA